MNARHRIEEWFRKLEQPGERLNREDVCFLMVQIRHLIETAPDPERYSVAAFYADWTVHTALNRSVVCFEVLRDITRVLVENLDPTSPDITTQISRIIGFPELRSELKNLFLDNGLPVVLFEYRENWRGFVMFLLWFLADQPIGFPENPKGPAKKIREEMLAVERPGNIAVEVLAIVNHEDVYCWSLQVSGDKQITIMGPVDIAEAADAFSAPPET